MSRTHLSLSSSSTLYISTAAQIFSSPTKSSRRDPCQFREYEIGVPLFQFQVVEPEAIHKTFDVRQYGVSLYIVVIKKIKDTPGLFKVASGTFWELRWECM